MQELQTRSTAGPPRVIDLLNSGGRPLDYGRYLRLQERLRLRRRELLLFCEHPPTITAGVQARPENLLSGSDSLEASGVRLVRIGRGGDHTAHEPGQWVIYPHIDLKARGVGISEYFRGLLEISAECLQERFGIFAESRADAPGLYTADGAKIASIGIMFKGFFTSHGLAINANNALEAFGHINPCGFSGLKVTSIAEQMGGPARPTSFVAAWRERFAELLSGERN